MFRYLSQYLDICHEDYEIMRARRSELAFRSEDFRALGNLTFLALSRGGIDPKFPQITRFAKKDVQKFEGRLY